MEYKVLMLYIYFEEENPNCEGPSTKVAPFYFSNAALTPAIIIINIIRNPSTESEAKNKIRIQQRCPSRTI